MGFIWRLIAYIGLNKISKPPVMKIKSRESNLSEKQIWSYNAIKFILS